MNVKRYGLGQKHHCDATDTEELIIKYMSEYNLA